MDILEKIYGFFSDRHREKRAQSISQFASHFERHIDTLTLLTQGLCGEGRYLFLRPVDGRMAVVLEDALLLPDKITFFDDYRYNRLLHLHQALSGAAVLKLNLRSSFPRSEQRFERALEVYISTALVRREINIHYPEYGSEFKDLLNAYKNRLSEMSSFSEMDQWFIKNDHRLKLFLIDNEIKSIHEGVLNVMKTIEFSDRVQNSTFAAASLGLWSELIRPKVCLSDFEESFLPPQSKKREKKGGQKMRRPNEIESINLQDEQKKENPVTHSFEKLETVDEYNGGYRHVDGSDQLDEHKDALSEIDLKNVTRSGEAAESVLNSDVSDLIDVRPITFRFDFETDFISLPEWNYNRNDLQPEYCKLWIRRDFDKSECLLPDDLSIVYSRLIEDKAQLLEYWKCRLESIVNQRRWRDRQWDGGEVSIDSFVRYFSDVKNSSNADPRVFLRQFKLNRNFSTIVLIDQSLSTDSWVMNRRVLDVEIESIVMMSYLLKDIGTPVSIAGTWSETRHRCHYDLYKDFHEPWGVLHERLKWIKPQGYTRLGPSIRYSIRRLSQTDTKEKLLIILTDGKPTDYDRYEGRYGIEDIRHAILEAKQHSIHVRALAIEKDAKEYFPHLFGRNEYQIIHDPEKLPEALFKIYLDAVRVR